jgi:hypothetical protein
MPAHTDGFGSESKDDQMAALFDLARRTGAISIGLRYQDDEEPVVWVAVGQWPERVWDSDAPEGKSRWEATGAMTPMMAMYRLLEQVMDGGICEDWTGAMPLEDAVCWYRFDPEMKTFRRSCEGD